MNGTTRIRKNNFSQKGQFYYFRNFKYILPSVIFLFSLSLTRSAAQSDHAETAFEHGWCVGRAHAILMIIPENIEAQNVEYHATRAFVLEGLERFGFTSRNRERLVEATLQMREQATAQAYAYIRQVGVSQASQEVRERWLPEMRRRCQY